MGFCAALAIPQWDGNAGGVLVAASDQFGDISEGNVGEYLKFLPGIGIDYTANDARAVSLRGMNPNFTNVTVDGGRMASGSSSGDNRRFELEQVAINNVETIEVFKTMTPDMSATDVTFTRRTGPISSMLAKNWTWGTRDQVVTFDPVEQSYEACFPAAVAPRATNSVGVPSWLTTPTMPPGRSRVLGARWGCTGRSRRGSTWRRLSAPCPDWRTARPHALMAC